MSKPFNLNWSDIPSEDEQLANMRFSFTHINNPLADKVIEMINNGKNVILCSEDHGEPVVYAGGQLTWSGGSKQVFIPFSLHMVIDGALIRATDKQKFCECLSLACMVFDKVVEVPLRIIHKHYPEIMNV